MTHQNKISFAQTDNSSLPSRKNQTKSQIYTTRAYTLAKTRKQLKNKNLLNQSFETDNTDRISKESIAPCVITPSSRWKTEINDESTQQSSLNSDSDSSIKNKARRRISIIEQDVRKQKKKKGCLSRCLKKQTKKAGLGNALGLADQLSKSNI